MQIGQSDESLQRGEEQNYFAQLIDEAGGLDQMEQLQSHNNEQIYAKAVSILETYFEVEEKGVENLQPGMDGGMYSFGGAPHGAQAAQAGGFNFGNPGAMA